MSILISSNEGETLSQALLFIILQRWRRKEKRLWLLAIVVVPGEMNVRFRRESLELIFQPAFNVHSPQVPPPPLPKCQGTLARLEILLCSAYTRSPQHKA